MFQKQGTCKSLPRRGGVHVGLLQAQGAIRKDDDNSWWIITLALLRNRMPKQTGLSLVRSVGYSLREQPKCCHTLGGLDLMAPFSIQRGPSSFFCRRMKLTHGGYCNIERGAFSFLRLVDLVKSTHFLYLIGGNVFAHVFDARLRTNSQYSCPEC